VRFVQGDEIWMNPNYKRDTCHINEMIYFPSLKTKTLYFSSVHDAIRKFNAHYIGGSISSWLHKMSKECTPNLPILLEQESNWTQKRTKS